MSFLVVLKYCMPLNLSPKLWMLLMRVILSLRAPTYVRYFVKRKQAMLLSISKLEHWIDDKCTSIKDRWLYFCDDQYTKLFLFLGLSSSSSLLFCHRGAGIYPLGLLDLKVPLLSFPLSLSRFISLISFSWRTWLTLRPAGDTFSCTELGDWTG